MTGHDALSAMPGDEIFYDDPEQRINGSAIVKSAGWQPSPKGGKVWTYETCFGDLVPNTSVSKVVKAIRSEPTVREQCLGITDAGKEIVSISDIHNMPSDVFLQQELLQIAEGLNLQPTYRVVLACILQNDAENIEVAAGLLKIRARQLRELEAAANGFGQLKTPSTTNPLKEDTHG